jgi:hypothetical protein
MKKGVPDGVAGTGETGEIPVVLRGEPLPQPGRSIAPIKTSDTSLDFFIAAEAGLLFTGTWVTLRCF